MAIPTQPFGSTGHESSRIIFGAAALGDVSQRDADAAIELLLERGVNHIDTAASYGDSELRLAPGLARYRDRFFLATKTGERTYAAARDQIQRSLERMQVPSVDLIQLHCLVHPDEWDVDGGDQFDVVNAMALPGGFFYVNSGLILAADNEAELAGVMAHESLHVVVAMWPGRCPAATLPSLRPSRLFLWGGRSATALTRLPAWPYRWPS